MGLIAGIIGGSCWDELKKNRKQILRWVEDGKLGRFGVNRSWKRRQMLGWIEERIGKSGWGELKQKNEADAWRHIFG